MTHYLADTVARLIERGDEDAPAIGAPGRPWLTHGGAARHWPGGPSRT